MRMITQEFAKDRDLVTNYEVRANIYANIFTDFGEKNLTLLNEFFSAGSQYLITPTLDVAFSLLEEPSVPLWTLPLSASRMKSASHCGSVK